MKIGILTFHRAINYGAVLQTYALQEVLRGLGHDVWVIDYRQPRVERNDRRPYQDSDKNELLKKLHIRSWLNYEKEKERVLNRRQRFDLFLDKYLNLTSSCFLDNIPNFDIYVIGSDQVWNSAICDGLDPVFWGDFYHNKSSKVVSYAASTSVKDLQKQNHEELQRLLSNFNKISVREDATCDYLNNSFDTNHVVKTVLDPTLLANKDIWNTFENSCLDVDYVLYFGARICNKYPTVLYDKALSLAKQMGCVVRSIDFNVDSPIDFVNKFRQAKAVVTSSFHGTAFSLIFNKPLYAVKYGDEQDARYENLLQSIGAGSMLVDIYQDVKPRLFDYNAINRNMKSIRLESLKYLKEL